MANLKDSSRLEVTIFFSIRFSVILFALLFDIHEPAAIIVKHLVQG